MGWGNERLCIRFAICQRAPERCQAGALATLIDKRASLTHALPRSTHGRSTIQVKGGPRNPRDVHHPLGPLGLSSWLSSPPGPVRTRPLLVMSEHNEKQASTPSSVDETADKPRANNPLDYAERRKRALAEIDNAKFSWFHVKIALIAGVGFFTDA